MWRDMLIYCTFMFLGVAALSNTLLELCKNRLLSTECNGTSLDCENVHIVHLKSFMVHADGKLQCLTLSNTHLTNIDDGSFEDHTSLMYLDLQGNMLSQLDYKLFTKLTELEYLDLSNNSLTTLTDERLFMSQVKLKVLKLSSNEISHVGVKVLAPLTSITTLSLSDNPFHCDCQILEILFLCRNRGLNTSVVCEEPRDVEGLTWDIIEDVSGCKENLGLLKSSSEEDYLVPKNMGTAHHDSVTLTVFIISLIIVIMVLVCASTALVFYIRRKKNKIQAQSENTVNSVAETDDICFNKILPPEVHNGTAYMVGMKLEGSGSNLSKESDETESFDVSKENLLDTEVLVKNKHKAKHLENIRYSGEYDNVCSNVKY